MQPVLSKHWNAPLHIPSAVSQNKVVVYVQALDA